MRRLASFFSVLIFLSVNVAFGQTDSLLLQSPFHVFDTHISNLNSGNYHPEIAARTIHPSILSPEIRMKKAERLKKILDAKGLAFDMAKVPKKGNYKDSLSGNEIYSPFPNQLPQVYVEKTNGFWTYSEVTSKAVDQMYEDVFPFQLGKLVDQLPQSVQQEFFGIKTWQYLGFLIIIGLAYLLYLLLNTVIDRWILGAKWYKEMNLEASSRPMLHKFVGYGVAYVMIHLIQLLMPSLLLDISISKVLYLLLDILQSIFIMMCLFKLVNLMHTYLSGITAKTESKLDDQLLPILVKVVKIIIGVVTVIHIMAISGVNVTALIAGVSIGGLALALAAQDTVKNFLGSIMIFFDKPFQIGDYIQTPDTEGVVEEVGFRSTRLRKTDTSLVSIPNGNLSNVTITNLGARKLRLLESNLSMRYDTNASNMQNFISQVRSYVENNEKIDVNQRLVYFRNMSASSLDIFIRVYIAVNDIQEELKIREEIFFEIKKIAENNHVDFAFPSTSLYIEQNPSKPGDKTFPKKE